MGKTFNTLRKHNPWEENKLHTGFICTRYSDLNKLIKIYRTKLDPHRCVYLFTDKETIDREYSALQAINDNYEKVAVSFDDITLPLNGGVRHIQAWKLSDLLQS